MFRKCDNWGLKLVDLHENKEWFSQCIVSIFNKFYNINLSQVKYIRKLSINESIIIEQSWKHSGRQKQKSLIMRNFNCYVTMNSVHTFHLPRNKQAFCYHQWWLRTHRYCLCYSLCISEHTDVVWHSTLPVTSHSRFHNHCSKIGDWSIFVFY